MRYHTHRESDYPVINERNHVTRLPLHDLNETEDGEPMCGPGGAPGDYTPAPDRKAAWRTHVLIVLCVLAACAACFTAAWLYDLFRR